jgi:hypothetical protein
MHFSRNYFAMALLMISLLIPVAGCDVVHQAQHVSNLVNCDFRIRTVENINLAGVALQNIRSVNDLSMGDVARIMAGFTSPIFPLSLQVNLEGRNPNSGAAGLNRIDWILLIDDIQMTSGIVEKSFTIPPGGSTVIPVDVGIDLKKVLSGKSATAMLNFCLNLAGIGGSPTRFKIKLKPTVVIGGNVLQYPGYITINTSYGGQ